MAQGTYAEIDDLQIPDDLALCSASDVDDRGIPLIFSKFALCRGRSWVKGGSRDSSCDRVSIPETIDYDTDLETLKGPVNSLLDSGGFRLRLMYNRCLPRLGMISLHRVSTS